MKRPRWHTEPDPEPGHPSKSQVKRDLIGLQEFGMALLEIPQERLEAIEMDERLREAFRELRRLTNLPARRRQAQFIGKLLRDADLEPLRRELAAKRAPRAPGPPRRHG